MVGKYNTKKFKLQIICDIQKCGGESGSAFLDFTQGRQSALEVILPSTPTLLNTKLEISI